MALSKEAKEIKRKRWEMCSPMAQRISNLLHKKGYLRVPPGEAGWGMADMLLIKVAEWIDVAVMEE